MQSQDCKVKLILAGFERGGTTLLSDIFRANGFESGFECGVLLGDEPRQMQKIQPYWDMLLTGWQISPEQRSKTINGNFAHFYNTLSATAFPDFDGPIFDKTPKYMQHLGRCLERAKFVERAIVIHRDPRSVFVSMAKRLEPDAQIQKAVERQFPILKNRYLSYFYGSIAHLENPKVLFVPFEELVSREEAWMKALGLFVTGKPFENRFKQTRFENTAANGMQLGKIIEFQEFLDPEMQKAILEATAIASPFFAGPVERAAYGDLWANRWHKAKKRIQEHNLEPSGVYVDGEYFEPLTYLIRYPDVLDAGVNPIEHYKNNGKFEGRRVWGE